jgi:hypothetical protein
VKKAVMKAELLGSQGRWKHSGWGAERRQKLIIDEDDVTTKWQDKPRLYMAMFVDTQDRLHPSSAS